MDSTDRLEVYRQRYETYRHLDRIRWQMLQIAIAVGALVVTFGGRGADGPEWWVIGGAGWLLCTLAVVMLRINGGITKNQQELAKAAVKTGDAGIPPIADWWKRSSFWVAASVFALGAVCLVLAIVSARSQESPCTESSSATTTGETRSTRNT